MIFIWLLSVSIITTLTLAVLWWIGVYNNFQSLGTKAQREFASIKILFQKRHDNILALAKATEHYHNHEYKTMRDTINARVGGGLLVFERYPNLKADKICMSYMEQDTELENQLNQSRIAYNLTAQKYNEKLRIFPQSIVASTHAFMEFPYLEFRKQEAFKPRDIIAQQAMF